MVTFYKDFESGNTLNISNLTFMLVSCNSGMKTCKQVVGCRFYKRSNCSYRVNCTKQFDVGKETTPTSTSSYHLAPGDAFNISIGRIHNLKCICKESDFGQTLATRFPGLKKADVKIDGFHEVPKLKKTVLKVIPANTSDVKTNNKEHFTVSPSDLRQTYHLAVTVESSPTCTN